MYQQRVYQDPFAKKRAKLFVKKTVNPGDLTKKFFNFVKREYVVTQEPSAKTKYSKYFLETSKLERQITEAEEKLNEFKSNEQINTLIQGINQTLSTVNTEVKEFQEELEMNVNISQAKTAAMTILEILQARITFLTRDFHKQLKERAEVIKTNSNKRSKLVSGSGPSFSKVRQRNNGKKARFLKEKSKGFTELDLEDNNIEENQPMMRQEMQHRSTNRLQSIQSINQVLGQVASLFQRMANIVQLHECMIERIDTETDQALHHVREGRKEIVTYYDYVKSNRKFILMVFIDLLSLTILSCFVFFFSLP